MRTDTHADQGAMFFSREIVPNIFWFGPCSAHDFLSETGRPMHYMSNAFLIVGRDQTLLFDTCLPEFATQLNRHLSEILKNRRLDWIVPSHAEIGHSGNLGRLLLSYPDAVAVGSVSDFHMFYPALANRVERKTSGSVIDLGGGYEFTFVDAPIKDAAATTWGYEKSQRVLFSVDAFAFSHAGPVDIDGESGPVHLPGECDRFTGEIGAQIDVSQATFMTKAALHWTRFVEIGPFFQRVNELFDTYPVDIVAPSHGNVITNWRDLMPVFREAFRLAYEGA